MRSYKKYIFFLFCMLFVLAETTYTRAQAPGFVQEEIIKISGITADAQIYGLATSQKNTIRTYTDGFGRPIQAVTVKGSPSQKDLIQVKAYDNVGREVTSYLPYTDGASTGNYRTGALTGQAAFYNNGNTDKVTDDTMPYSQAVFENSPLQRLLIAGSIGNGFQPDQHARTVGQRPNQGVDQVIKWSPEGNNYGFYPENSLWVIVSTDEDGHQSAVFSDANGKIILKRTFVNEVVGGVNESHFDTYYIYNEAGGLIWTVPPKAISFIINNPGANLNTAEVKKLLFNYVYDQKGRIIEKTVPASSVIYTVYDPLNKPVLIQDGNLRTMGQWNYIKYDIRGRIVSQGIYTDAVHLGRSDMQNYVNSLDYSQNYYESRSSTAATGYYTNMVFPSTGLHELAYSYFDNYDLDQNGTADYSYITQGLTSEAQPTSLTRGLLTMVRKRGIGGTLANSWLTNVQFYDKQGNIIQTIGNTQLNANVTNSKTVVPDFTGQIIRKKIQQYSSSGNTSVLTEYSYDHVGRPLAISQQYNNGSMIRISGYEYNEIGQLVDRKLHSTNGGASWLQSVDYRYNISGRMTSINNSSLTVNEKNDDGNDLFGMEIGYEQADAGLGAAGYYNGLISSVKWSTSGNGNQRSYRFDYDSAQRLKNAIYAQGTLGSGSWAGSSGYDEKNIRYDQNGNILSLQRNALVNNTATPVDELNYSYDGNQLKNLSDGSGGSYSQIGFKNLTGSPDSYAYTASGNLSSDPKKGISLSYNLIDKTDRITINTASGRYIDYSYDASGTLLRKQVYDNNISVKITDYIDDFVYENGQLSYFGMPEGRIRNTGNGLKSEYIIKDYQGNARISFEDQNGIATLRQENSYYPFGLIMTGSSVATPTSANVNLYNAGAEWQNDFSDLPDYYTTFYRNYDPATGRFVAIDPKAELVSSSTPYNYTDNNPILFNDPLGDIRLSQDAQRLVDGVYQASGGVSGTWTAATGFNPFSSDAQGFNFATDILGFDAFGQNGLYSYGQAAASFNQSQHTGGNVAAVWRQLREVNIAETRTNQNWLIDRQKEAFGVQNSTTTPWQVGWEWASGEGPRDRIFTNGDTFTEMLRQHSHIDATRNIIRSRIMSTNSTSKGSNPYILGGIDGVGLYIKDYSTLLTAGKTGNLAVTYLGSYGLKYAVTSIDGDMAMVTFTVTNSSTISSATHPPIIGYTNWWNKNIGDPMNRSFSSGPFSKTTQTFIWMENLKWK